MAPFILGLDLGPNSIGWAMLAMDPETAEPCGLADTSAAQHPPMGVRVFEAGLQNFDTAKEASLNQSRRTARSMRRNHARRNARRRRLRELLAAADLLPGDDDSLAALMRQDPYELRARALTGSLNRHELGRALYHLGQRRGFKSNRKSGDAKEDEGILLEIGQLEQAIKAAGCRTLGQYLHHLADGADGPDLVRLRARHTRRDMYEAEFDAIVAQQREHHAAALTNTTVAALREAIFFQHPFEVTEERRAKAPSRANLHRAPSVRPCPLERGELCAPKGDWHAQEFRILKEVANLRIAEHHGRDRELTPEERKAVIDRLASKDRVKFDDLRKLLAKRGVDPDAKFNLERGGRSGLLGNSVEYKLAANFKKSWQAVPDADKAELRSLLVHAEDPEEVAAVLVRCGLDTEKATKLKSWTPADGYLGYSLAAVHKLLPYLREGLDEYAAIEKAYPDRPAAGRVDKLPPVGSPDLPPDLAYLTNPIVRRALVEVRKVVNAIIREHGVPARIVIELAREMKEGREQRRETGKRIRDREKERAEAAARVAELGGNPHSRSDVNRWLFWREQGGICVYTGRPIPASELFHGGEWEVDHILPRWRSLDDSYMNKVLVHREANEAKGDRTPAEWLGAGSETFMQLLRRADTALERSGLPFPKYRRLKTLELDTDEFASRQLNDTRYITRVVALYLGLLYPPELRVGEKAIQTCRGGLTAELRRQWGLNNLLPPLHNADGEPVVSGRTDSEGNPLKSRDDHRHHAIDAVVVALSSRRILKRYQDYWKMRTKLADGNRPDFPKPWDALLADVRDAAGDIIVSHRAQRKIAGAFHEETFYGPARDRNGAVLADRYVTRKTLAALTGKMIDNIRDEAVRRLVTARLRESGWDGTSKDLPKDWHTRPLLMPSGVPVRKVRIEVPIKNAARLKHRYAILGNNHHIAIVGSTAKNPDGRPARLWAKSVSTMEAAARVRREGKTVVERDYGPDKELVMSLARKESVWISSPVTGERALCVVQIISGSPVLSSGMDLTLRDARDSRPAAEGNKSPFKRIKSFKTWPEFRIEKVQVDPLGRIEAAND